MEVQKKLPEISKNISISEVFDKIQKTYKLNENINFGEFELSYNGEDAISIIKEGVKIDIAKKSDMWFDILVYNDNKDNEIDRESKIKPYFQYSVNSNNETTSTNNKNNFEIILKILNDVIIYQNNIIVKTVQEKTAEQIKKTLAN